MAGKNIWPSKDLVKYFSPSNFKAKFPTRVLVDDTEYPLKNPKAQQATFFLHLIKIETLSKYLLVLHLGD